MGFRVCYIATKASPDTLIARMKLEARHPVQEMPDNDWWVAQIKATGWTILWSEDQGFVARSQTALSQLSQDALTYACEANETVMWSSAELWQGGARLWKVSHAGDGEDIFDLSENGDLPESYPDLKTTLFEAQRADGGDVDHIFDLPIALAAAETGFRYDMYLSEDSVEEFLLVAPPARKGFLARLFG